MEKVNGAVGAHEHENAAGCCCNLVSWLHFSCFNANLFSALEIYLFFMKPMCKIYNVKSLAILVFKFVLLTFAYRKCTTAEFCHYWHSAKTIFKQISNRKWFYALSFAFQFWNHEVCIIRHHTTSLGTNDNALLSTRAVILKSSRIAKEVSLGHRLILTVSCALIAWTMSSKTSTTIPPM